MTRTACARHAQAVRRHRTLTLAAASILLLAAAWLVVRAVDDVSGTSVDRAAQGIPAPWQSELVGGGLEELRTGRARGLPPLSSSLGAAEGVPSSVRRLIERNRGSDSMRLRFGQAQHLSTSVGVGFWIIEGRGVTCLYREPISMHREETLASSCRKTVDARQEGITLETYRVTAAHPDRPSHFLAIGIAPTGARAVSVRMDDSPAKIPVRNGAWGARSERPIDFQSFIR